MNANSIRETTPYGIGNPSCRFLASGPSQSTEDDFKEVARAKISSPNLFRRSGVKGEPATCSYRSCGALSFAVGTRLRLCRFQCAQLFLRDLRQCPAAARWRLSNCRVSMFHWLPRFRSSAITENPAEISVRDPTMTPSPIGEQLAVYRSFSQTGSTCRIGKSAKPKAGDLRCNTSDPNTGRHKPWRRSGSASRNL